MADTRSHGWREYVADWITDGTLATLRAEKSIAAQMVARTPDRAAALQDVETLLRRVHDVTEEADDVVRFYLAGDGAFLRDQVNVTAADLAALIVDRVLGAEQDGGAAAT